MDLPDGAGSGGDGEERKKDALNTFENVTKTILTDEITSNSRAKLEQLKEGHQEVESRLHYTETVIKKRESLSQIPTSAT